MCTSYTSMDRKINSAGIIIHAGHRLAKMPEPWPQSSIFTFAIAGPPQWVQVRPRRMIGIDVASWLVVMAFSFLPRRTGVHGVPYSASIPARSNNRWSSASSGGFLVSESAIIAILLSNS